MDFINRILEFILNEEKKVSAKAAIIFMSIIGVIIVDNVFSFSYSYSTDRKIEQIKKLNEIIIDSASDKATKQYAITLRKEISKRQNVFEISKNYLAEIHFSNDKKLPKEPNKEENIAVIKPNIFWFNFSSSFFFYIVAIISIPIIVFTDKTSSLSQRLVTSSMVGIMFAGLGIFFYWICSLIPMILDNSWLLNYFLNFIIQVGIIYLVFKLGNANK